MYVYIWLNIITAIKVIALLHFTDFIIQDLSMWWPRFPFIESYQYILWYYGMDE